MKTSGIYIFSLFSFIMGVTACSDNDEVDCRGAIQTIQTQLQESDLLKSSAVEGDNYVLSFETKTVELPANTVQSLTTNPDEWKSILTFIDGSSYTIPSVGTSIDKLVTNVIVNPSGYNPLSAYAVMNLPALGRMKMTVHSKDGHRTPDIEYFFKSIEKGQTVTILGLYPDYKNKVTLVYTDKDGKERARSTIHIQTEKLKNPNLRRYIPDGTGHEPDQFPRRVGSRHSHPLYDRRRRGDPLDARLGEPSGIEPYRHRLRTVAHEKR